MRISLPLQLFSLVATYAVESPVPDHIQALLSLNSSQEKTPDRVHNLAIIGAGIAGAVAAFEARNSWDRWSHLTTLNITVFESDERLGGRVKAVTQFNGIYDQVRFAHTGAKWIHENDECMRYMIESVGLHKYLESSREATAEVGIWDGRILRRRSDAQIHPRTWRDNIRLVIEFGRHITSLRRRIVDGSVHLARFWTVLAYNHGLLSKSMRQDGVDSFAQTRASDFPTNDTGSRQYVEQIIEPLLRSRYLIGLYESSQTALFDTFGSSESLSFDSGFKTMQTVVERLLTLAEARRSLDSRVKTIERTREGTYVLRVETKGSDSTVHTPFDSVVIAASLSTAGLEVLGAPSRASSEHYHERHVTHFATPRDLSPIYFNLPSHEDVPRTLFTQHTSPDLPFLSIEKSWTDKDFHEDPSDTAYLYRVVSATAVPDGLILDLLGQPNTSDLRTVGVDWVHRQMWPNGARIFERAEPLESIQFAHGLYYAGAADDILTSLESSCQFGRLAGKMTNFFA